MIKICTGNHDETLNGSLLKAQEILSEKQEIAIFFLDFMISKAQNLNDYGFMACLCCLASGRPVLKMLC